MIKDKQNLIDIQETLNLNNTKIKGFITKKVYRTSTYYYVNTVNNNAVLFYELYDNTINIDGTETHHVEIHDIIQYINNKDEYLITHDEYLMEQVQ